MAGTTIILHDDEVQAYLDQVARRMQRTRELHAELGQLVRTSVVRNFEREGRPEKWKPLAASTVRGRRGKAHPILRRQGFAGGLMGSVNVLADDERASVGTNKVYAAIHQFGGTIKRRARRQTLAFDDKGRFMSRKKAGQRKKKAVRVAFAEIGEHTVTIPARPFLMIQDQDWPAMKRAAATWLLTGETST